MAPLIVRVLAVRFTLTPGHLAILQVSRPLGAAPMWPTLVWYG